MKADQNDHVGAMLATQGAQCGILLTQDTGLLERISFLKERGFIRIQAFDFFDTEAHWNPPPLDPPVAA
jgi:hypothetical protein